jgi:uncharacterized protein YjbJ (UPF0337 family)
VNTQAIQGQWNTIRGKVKEKWGQLTEDDLQMLGGSIEQVIGKIQRKTGEQREKIEHFINGLVTNPSVERAKEATMSYAQDTAERVRETYGSARDYAAQQYNSAGEVVSNRPVESLAVVLGAGMITGVLVGLILCSDSHR